MKRCQVGPVQLGLVVAVLVSGCSCSNIVVAWPDSGAGGGGGTSSDGGMGGGAGGGGGGGGIDPDGGACLDRDADGFGVGNCLGPDCDDSDPQITTDGVVRCFSLDAGVVPDGGACKAGSATCKAGVVGLCMNEVGPSREQCNGLDDDCNGAIDDGVPAVVCYEGPPASLDAGTSATCRSGLSTCIKGGYGLCVGAVVPTAEVCANGKDDNCNGQKDEPPCAEGTYVCAGCTGAKDTNPGTQNSPVATIGQGIKNAVALGTSTVFVAGVVAGVQQTYSEDVIIPNGVVVQGRWAVISSSGNNAWARTADRTLLTNSNSTGVKFAPGASRSSGLDGLAIQAAPSSSRVVGISIVNASPLLKDFAVLSTNLSATPPSENIGVLVTGTPLIAAFPRLEGTATTRCEIGTGLATVASVGIRVTNARFEGQYLDVNAGPGGPGVSSAVHLLNAPQSELRDAELHAGLASSCIGFFAQGNSGGVVVQNVNATGCPPPGAGAPAGLTGVGIAFEACPMVTNGANPLVKNSYGRGGTTAGPKSLAMGAAAVDGCHVNFAGNTLIGGQSDGVNIPETEIGLHCGYQGLVNMVGKDSACRATSNTISAGSAPSPTAVGMNCQGSCEAKTLACTGACELISENSIVAPLGTMMIHLSIVNSAPLVSLNRIGPGPSPVIATNCGNNGSVIAVSLDSSNGVLVNNMITGGPCQLAVGISQLNRLRAGDSSVPAPTVHFNTIVASGSGLSPAGATSIGLQLGSTLAVPAVPRGIYRSNILVAGPVSGQNALEIVVREADVRSDPATFWNNLLNVPGALFPTLYLNEGGNPILSEAGVNAMGDISSQGNLHAVPGFFGPAVGDYHLTGASPARGAASVIAVPATDYDGQPRPNPAGGNPDIGADEVP
ncbi:MAG: Tryptophan synthase alpha chain [Myxococcaceae bacterium]|nr:Tryptophan synthase alpha chain [Myxococcaceae bacterium]